MAFSCLYIRIYYGIYFSQLDNTPIATSRGCEKVQEPARKSEHEKRKIFVWRKSKSRCRSETVKLSYWFSYSHRCICIVQHWYSRDTSNVLTEYITFGYLNILHLPSTSYTYTHGNRC